MTRVPRRLFRSERARLVALSASPEALLSGPDGPERPDRAGRPDRADRADRAGRRIARFASAVRRTAGLLRARGTRLRHAAAVADAAGAYRRAGSDARSALALASDGAEPSLPAGDGADLLWAGLRILERVAGADAADGYAALAEELRRAARGGRC